MKEQQPLELANIANTVLRMLRRIDVLDRHAEVAINRPFDTASWTGSVLELPDYSATVDWSEETCEDLFASKFEAFFMGTAVAFNTAEISVERSVNAISKYLEAVT